MLTCRRLFTWVDKSSSRLLIAARNSLHEGFFSRSTHHIPTSNIIIARTHRWQRKRSVVVFIVVCAHSTSLLIYSLILHLGHKTHFLSLHRQQQQQQRTSPSTMLDLFTYSSFREMPTNVAYHYKHGNLNYPMIIYISLVHFVAIAGLFYLTEASRETLLWAFVLWPIRYVSMSPNSTRVVSISCVPDLSSRLVSPRLVPAQWVRYYRWGPQTLESPFV